jgi:hypothetical protein
MTGNQAFFGPANSDLPLNPTLDDIHRIAEIHALNDPGLYAQLIENMLSNHPHLIGQNRPGETDRGVELPRDWMPKRLDLDGDYEAPQPDRLFRRDGPALFYPSMVHVLFGEPESGKTWIALQAVAETQSRGNNALYIDFEMTRETITHRLKAIGALTMPFYVQPETALDENGWRNLGSFISAENIPVVILDGTTEAMSLHGLDPNSNQDAATWGNYLKILTKSGTAVVLIDHVTKSKENRGRGPIGAQHKLAGADVALRVEVHKQPDPSRPGTFHIFVTKDRPGVLRRHANDANLWAIVTLTPDDGKVLIEIDEPPTGHATSNTGKDFRPTWFMERVSEWLEQNPPEDGSKPPSRNQIEKGVRGNVTHIRQAIDALVAEGYIEETSDNGKRNTRLHSYTEDNDTL